MRRLLLPFLCGLLAGCGADRLAGGNSTEADNALTGFVIDSLGRPAVGARVTAMPSRSVEASQRRETTTDGAGAWRLPAGDGTWMVEVQGEGLRAATVGSAGTLPPRLVLARPASLSGRARLDLPGAVEVAVRGSLHRTRTDSLGRWRLDSLPAGVALEVVAIGATGDTACSPGQILSAGEAGTAALPLQLSSAWAAESTQVATLLGALGVPAGQVRRRIGYDSSGVPTGLFLDSLGLDSLPAGLTFPAWVHDVDLKGNRLTRPPVALSTHTGLWNLDLGGNSMETVSWSGFPELSSLSLARCGLKELPDLSSLASLAYLALDDDSLSTLPAWIWAHPALVTISVKSNRLDSLPAVGATSAIRALQLGGNRLKRLPEGWRNLASLRELWLYGNSLDSLPDSLGTALPTLRRLHLEGTGLTRLPSSLASLPADSMTLNVLSNRLCADQGTALETWLDRVFGAPWRTSQPQLCP